MIWEDLKPSDIIDRRSVENALVVHNALAGSTNAMIHLVAMARRAGVPITLKDFDDFAQKVPVIANLRPSGAVADGGFLHRRRHPRAVQAAASRSCTSTRARSPARSAKGSRARRSTTTT